MAEDASEGERNSRFSDELRAQAAPLWQRVHAHPFVQGMADGSLPLVAFRYYMVQDYLFLVEFCRVLALGAAKSHELETMGRFAGLLHETLHTEMALHRAYAAKFGIGEAELEAAEPSATTHAYTRHLLHAAQAGTLGELAAALLPCQWGYAEIGQALDRTAPQPRHEPYGEWIAAYASPEFGALAEWLRALVDRLGAEAGAAERGRMARHFLHSSRYEFMFWDAAYRQAGWPV
ncbi:MAG TPA: thiaminase II [Dehalococcoidia bacterium]|nr:thiaminase II [Dehalococcoidia bacterium]